MLRNRHLLALDFLFFCLAPAAALALRLEDLGAVARYAEALALYILVAALLRWAVFLPMGLYVRAWRYAGVEELVQIVLAVFISTAVVVLAFFGVRAVSDPFCSISSSAIYHSQPAIRNLQSAICHLHSAFSTLPRSIPLLEGLLVLLAVGGLRFSLRWMERTQRRRGHRAGSPVRVVVLGAGEAGAMIVQEMKANPHLGLEPVAFLDDDPCKRGTIIHGVRVVGDCRQVAQMVRKYHAQQAIIAMPSAPGKTIRELARLCQEADIPVRIIPGLLEILAGRASVSHLRPVDVTDLLRREPVKTDTTAIGHLLRGRRVLVTGAGGSIGRELCRQILLHNPGALVLLGHGENSIFEISNELSLNSECRIPNPCSPISLFPNSPIPNSQPSIIPIIADIRDVDRLRAVFERYRPEVVFHAAAHKHVPLMEMNVEDAVTNNVLGTRNLLELALAFGVTHFILISTDKAVNPTSVMGATKRVAELLVQEAAVRSGRCFVSVRFGNVLDSRGSVVPLFRQQIARGGPVTVTHPEARRYFMTIPEAVQLVLQAAVLGKGGEIFVLDMGEPIRIVDLARDLIRLSGFDDGEIEIQFIGLRPGEKLFEELFASGEHYERTAHEKIFVARNGVDERGESGALLSTSLDFSSCVDALIAAARRGQPDEALRLLRELVPEYNPAGLPSDSLGSGMDLRIRP